MKYLIISDIHGALPPVEKVLKIYNEGKFDKLLILGDVLYHGPRNDLPSGYNPKAVIALLNPMKDNIICVQGNCDAEVDQMVLAFPIQKHAVVEDGIKVYLTHGHHINPESPIEGDYDVVLYGHTHVHKIEQIGKTFYINPGSISIPKEDKIASYAIMENNTICVYDFDSNLLMKYVK